MALALTTFYILTVHTQLEELPLVFSIEQSISTVTPSLVTPQVQSGPITTKYHWKKGHNLGHEAKCWPGHCPFTWNFNKISSGNLFWWRPWHLEIVQLIKRSKVMNFLKYLLVNTMYYLHKYAVTYDMCLYKGIHYS